MRVLVYEPRLPGGGHYMHHVGLILEALNHFDVEVTLLCHRGVREDKSFNTFVEPALTQQVLLSPLVSGEHIGRKGFHNFARTLSDYVRISKVDWVLIPTADGILQYLGATRWFGKGRPRNLQGIEGLLLNGKVGYSDKSFANVKNKFSQFAVSCAGLNRYLYFDPNAAAILSRAPWFVGVAEVAPEPIERVAGNTKIAARHALNLRVPGRLVVSAGRQDLRKGVDILIDAFAQVAEAQDKLLLIGPHATEVTMLLEQQHSQLLESGKIVSRNEFVSNEDLLNAIFAADVVGLPYRTPFMSSGILHRAIHAERMVLTSNRGLLGQLATTFGLGHVADVDSKIDFANKLKQCLVECANWQMSARILQLQSFHTEDNFKNTWTAGIAEAIGKPSSSRVRWETVHRANAQ